MDNDNPAPRIRRVKLMDKPRRTKMSEGKAQIAQRALRNAAAERALARHAGPNAPAHLSEADRIESFAKALMTPVEPPVVRSGEVVHASGGYGPPQEFIDTLNDPDQAAIEASVARAELLVSANADVVAMGVDAAASAKAGNSFEKMLAHQLAIIHVLTMKTGVRALQLDKGQSEHSDALSQADSADLARMSQATSRLSSAFQDGLLTLQRLRNGSSHMVTVRHVTLEAGAQAIIGNVEGGGGSSDKPGRGKRK